MASRPRLHVCLVALNRGFGLARDIAVLRRVLVESGAVVTPYLIPAWNVRHKWRTAWHQARQWRTSPPTTPRYDVTIFLEAVSADLLPWARRNYLVLNQEWFDVAQRPLLHQLDAVLCKSQHAARIVTELGLKAEYISFSSLDQGTGLAAPEGKTFLHVAGKSPLKGSQKVLEIWRKHPEWPGLLVIGRHLDSGTERALNIRVRRDVTDADVRAAQTAHAVHLCPSEAEGFGHYIAEGMSCGAVVVTTDAPPMNELVRNDRGVLVPVAGFEPLQLGTRFFVDPHALEQRIEDILAADPADLRSRGHRARNWFLQNHRFFERRVREVVVGV